MFVITVGAILHIWQEDHGGKTYYGISASAAIALTFSFNGKNLNNLQPYSVNVALID